jgi:hypothetical protein
MRHVEMLELSDKEFRMAVMHMLRAVMKKINNMQGLRSTVSR